MNKIPQNKVFTKGYDTVALLLQGGGALGAYQVGYYQALQDAGINPNLYIGTSIGAINASILAGNPPKENFKNLLKFWDVVTIKETWGEKVYNSFFSSSPFLKNFSKSQKIKEIFINGIAGFFQLKPFSPQLYKTQKIEKMGHYDTTPLHQTLERLIDFEYLNNGPNRVVLTAVDLETGKRVYFDNKGTTLTAKHIMASGALAPGFPPVRIKGRYYVDGGLTLNTQIDFLLKTDDLKSTLCFMADLFSTSEDLPTTFDTLLLKLKEINFSSYGKNLLDAYVEKEALARFLHKNKELFDEKDLENPILKNALSFLQKRKVDIFISALDKTTALSTSDVDFYEESYTQAVKEGREDIQHILSQKNLWETLSSGKESLKVYKLDRHDAIKTIE